MGSEESNLSEQEATKAVTIQNSAELKDFLLGLRDKMEDRTAAPIIVLAAMNHVMNLANVNSLLDPECKELARDIWLRLKQAGIHVKNPPLLFEPDEKGN